MLAYVFWHWPTNQIDRSSYIELLLEFHETLRSNAPRGFLRSIVLSASNVPGPTTSTPGFEDWYLLEDSASLDTINSAAVSGACETPHNAVAQYAAGGTAGLYRLHSGEEALRRARHAVWFSKPTGVAYSKLYESLLPITSRTSVGLWQRQMTLGPTTEFAVYSFEEVELPPIIETNRVELELAWPR